MPPAEALGSEFMAWKKASNEGGVASNTWRRASTLERMEGRLV